MVRALYNYSIDGNVLLQMVCQLIICKLSAQGLTIAVFDFFCPIASLRLQDRSGWKKYTYAAVKVKS